MASTTGELPRWRRTVPDANVLIQAPIRDTLLRAAEVGLLMPHWGPTLLEEVRRNLPTLLARYPDANQRAENLIRQRGLAFPRALVSDDPHGLTPLPLGIARGRVHPGDAHVLAAAIHARAGTIVTYNRRHFPPKALAPFRVVALTPAQFLLRLLAHERGPIVALLRQQGDDLRPACALDAVLARLERDVPQFVAAVRLLLAEPGPS